MLTVGVDLAAEATKTAVAVVAWEPGRAVVRSVAIGQDDAAICAAARDAAKVGIDAPLGWPEPFVEFLAAHQTGGPLAATDLAGRRLLAYRGTDRVVMAGEGLRPLSVAADRIGHAAMRAAGLLAALAAAGHDVDRSGGGLVVEVYPAAALKRWGLRHRRYKGAASAVEREALVADLAATMPTLDLGEFVALCGRSDDALDAVVCALIARAAALGRTTTPNAEQRRLARIEGWIGVPVVGLDELVSEIT